MRPLRSSKSEGIFLQGGRSMRAALMAGFHPLRTLGGAYYVGPMIPRSTVVDPTLVRNWLSARSIARGLPRPVPDSGGWRVDTASAEEARRYVFANPADGLRRLGETVGEPRVLLKLCGSEDLMREMLPRRWQIQRTSYMMVRASSGGAEVPLPRGYRKVPVEQNGPVITSRIYTSDGALAASGYAVETEQVFIYDRILTETDHRRLGLATAVMAILSSRRRSKASRQVLVATPQGRCLYEELGWEIYSPYTTASLPS